MFGSGRDLDHFLLTDADFSRLAALVLGKDPRESPWDDFPEAPVLSDDMGNQCIDLLGCPKTQFKLLC